LVGAVNLPAIPAQVHRYPIKAYITYNQVKRPGIEVINSLFRGEFYKEGVFLNGIGQDIGHPPYSVPGRPPHLFSEFPFFRDNLDGWIRGGESEPQFVEVFPVQPGNQGRLHREGGLYFRSISPLSLYLKGRPDRLPPADRLGNPDCEAKPRITTHSLRGYDTPPAHPDRGRVGTGVPE